VNACLVDTACPLLTAQVNSLAHAEARFLNVGGSQKFCRDCAAAVNSQASLVSIWGGKFEDLVAAPGARYIQAFEGVRTPLTNAGLNPLKEK
jgi:hypothetical protein